MTNPQDTQPVKIFQNTYQLPSLAGGQMQSIQTKIQNRQSLIQSGQKVVEVIVQEPVETSSGFLGFGKRVEMRGVPQRTTQPLTPEERFHALESQIQDYDRLMALLKEHKTAYQQFLGNLCDEVQQIIHQKFQQITQAEQIRSEFQREAEAEQDQEMISLALEQKRGLLQSLVELGKVARLFFKKIEYISQGIEKLSEDSEGSKQFLHKMVKKLKVYKKGMESQQAITKVKQDIAQLTQVALDLESYLQDALGPLHGLISSISEVDGQLTRTVEEIRNLSAELVSSEGGMFDFSSAQDVAEGLLSFEVARVQKQTRLHDALAAAQSQEMTITYTAMDLSQQAVAQLSIAEQIQTIQAKVQQEVQGFQGRVTIAVEPIQPVQLRFITQSAPQPELPSNVKSDRLSFLVRSDAQPLDQVLLETEKGANYTKLRDLLKAQKWKEADQETYRLMITIVGRKEGDYFRKEELLNFPCKDLKTIDRLWVQTSQGCYGFSVQKEIYVRCGGKLDGKYPGDEIWRKFGTEVGWRVNNEWQDYDDLTWNSIHVPGHLPCDGFRLGFRCGGGRLGAGRGGRVVSSLAQRLVKCNL